MVASDNHNLEPFEPYRRFQAERQKPQQQDFDYDAAVEEYTRVFDSTLGSTAIKNTFFEV